MNTAQLELIFRHLPSQLFSNTFRDRFLSKLIFDGPIPSHRPDLGPCWIWIGATRNGGYGDINRGFRYQGKIGAHQAAWVMTFGLIPDGLCVCHHCDNPPCCNPNHLFVATRAENNRDMFRKHRNNNPKGEANGRSKRTAEQIIAIRAATGSIGSISSQFGVDRKDVWLIRHRRLWSHV